jgi:hypothetical protein
MQNPDGVPDVAASTWGRNHFQLLIMAASGDEAERGARPRGPGRDASAADADGVSAHQHDSCVGDES